MSRVEIIARGGAASQLLAVAMGLYVKFHLKREFTILYEDREMVHTDRFELTELLEETEQLVVVPRKIPSPHKGNRIMNRLPVHLRPFLRPAQDIYQFIRLMKPKIISLVKSIWTKKDKKLLLEKVPNENKLWEKITPDTLTINAALPASTVTMMADLLSKRFTKTQFQNPFESNSNKDLDLQICLHYRLGDTRTQARWINSHGVLDPRSFTSLISKKKLVTNENFRITVITDEPEVAKKIFSAYNLFFWEVRDKEDIWASIKHMVNANIFIGSFSTVSMVAAAIRNAKNKDNTYLPLNARTQKIHNEARQDNVTYFRSRVFSKDHWVHSYNERQ